MAALKEDRSEVPKEDRWVGRMEGRSEDRMEVPKEDRWVGRMEDHSEGLRGDHLVGRMEVPKGDR